MEDDIFTARNKTTLLSLPRFPLLSKLDIFVSFKLYILCFGTISLWCFRIVFIIWIHVLPGDKISYSINFEIILR